MRETTVTRRGQLYFATRLLIGRTSHLSGILPFPGVLSASAALSLAIYAVSSESIGRQRQLIYLASIACDRPNNMGYSLYLVDENHLALNHLALAA